MQLSFKNRYITTCTRDGEKVWEEDIFNLVTDEGLQHIMDVYFTLTATAGNVFVGLKGEGLPSFADTLSNHPSWGEVVPYSGSRKRFEGVPTVIPGLSNKDTRMVYDINLDETVGGVFLATVDSGASGTLWSVADFESARAVKPGDVLTLSIELQARSA